MKRYKKLSEEILHKNPWWTYKHDKFQLPNGKEGDYYYFDNPGGSMVVPILDDGRIILVRQYRYLFDKDGIEFCAGGIEDGQTPEGAARAELEEETGYQGDLKFIGEFASSQGFSKELVRVFLVKNLKKEESHPEETEEIEILLKTPEEIDKMIESNEIWGGETMAAWAMVRKYFK
ncbi:NUDIX hydrolase [Patescibacteria group bacterium]|nr:NUDIX hydrolase [Patescibacteria group bacterium]